MPKIIETKNDALKFAMKLIGLRRRSEAEIRQRLEAKGCDTALTEETVAELYRYKYLNDEMFAESYINDRINFRPAGRFAITNELKKKGIAPNIIKDKLDELMDKTKELELAEKLVEKKIRTSGTTDEKKLRSRIVYHLQSRGFSAAIASQAMKNKLKLDINIIEEDE
ncbi:MAG: regulatory protein RecX [Candidatus Pacebacteria bacterium]|jgi:regulatory protein|nr:regulatory protein RecX [Candidatus Paceibacterota bacterium]